MTNQSHYESRTGSLQGTAEECFRFVTDIRNFERFIPKGNINNWQAERESCSFSVAMLGTVSVRIVEAEEFSRVVFNGDALKKNDFNLFLHFTGDINKPAEVKVVLTADLNPMMKMIAANPIGQFLEMLINEMEKFSGWKELKQ
jgi:hypothetical protein